MYPLSSNAWHWFIWPNGLVCSTFSAAHLTDTWVKMSFDYLTVYGPFMQFIFAGHISQTLWPGCCGDIADNEQYSSNVCLHAPRVSPSMSVTPHLSPHCIKGWLTVIFALSLHPATASPSINPSISSHGLMGQQKGEKLFIATVWEAPTHRKHQSRLFLLDPPNCFPDCVGLCENMYVYINEKTWVHRQCLGWQCLVWQSKQIN